jgi:hypothetical protein
MPTVNAGKVAGNGVLATHAKGTVKPDIGPKAPDIPRADDVALGSKALIVGAADDLIPTKYNPALNAILLPRAVVLTPIVAAF